MQGLDGVERMKETGERLREEPPYDFAGTKVVKLRDYLNHTVKDIFTGEVTKLDEVSSDVLFYELEDGCDVIYRPSGTEPKVKLYILSNGKDMKEAKEKSKKYIKAIKALI